MATVRCSGCSNLVAFRGKSAACPKCATTLRLPGPGDLLDLGESGDPTIGPAVPTLVAVYGRTKVTTVAAARQSGGMAALVVGLGALVVAVGVGLAGLWYYLSLAPSAPPAPVAVTPPPAAPVKPQPAPPPPKPAPLPATTQAAPPPPPVWTPIRPKAPDIDLRAGVTPARIEQSLRRGVDHLLSQFNGPYLKDAAPGDHISVGRNALAVYALLVAGKELQEPRLDVRTPMMREMLDRVKTSDVAGDRETYVRSVRVQALALANRPEDRPTIDADLRWMMRANVGGAFGYRDAGTATERDQIPGGWDTSCSQYGLLAAWAAALSGLDVPQRFYADVEAFWLSIQDVRTGAWNYRGSAPSVAMTTAGVNALVVAGDALGNSRGGGPVGSRNAPPLRDVAQARAAIQRGLEFLAAENRIAQFDRETGHYGYTAYGIERVGLATGFKYIGGVDWFRTIAAKLIAEQGEDGSWKGRSDPAPVDTAFSVLFLARGRPPVMMAKLRYDPPPPPPATRPMTPAQEAQAAALAAGTGWQKYPRDLANLAFYASAKTERPLNWQIVDLRQGWRDWLDAPVVSLSGSVPVPLTDADVDNLRQYTINGGMIFTHADNGSEDFTRFVTELAPKIVPGGKLEPLPPDHPIYSMVFKPSPGAPLMGLSNGNRLVLVHSPTEITNRWQRRVPAAQQQNLELGLNLFVYAAGRTLSRQRTDSPVLTEPTQEPVGTITLARVPTEGPAGWDPEPAGWPRAARALELATRIRTNIQTIRPAGLASPVEVPVAVITATAGATLPETDAEALRRWVQAGGTLIVDAVGGTKPSAEAAVALSRKVLGAAPLGAALTPTDALLTGQGYSGFGTDVSRVRVNDYTLGDRGGRQPAPRATRLGKGLVITSELDLTTGLLGAEAWGIAGYTKDWAAGFTSNLLLSVAAGTPGDPGPWPTPNP